MRSLLAVAAVASALAASPAAAQSWSGTLPDAPGQSRSLTFSTSALDDVIGWELYVAYSADMFEAPTFASSIAVGPMDSFGFSSPSPAQSTNFAGPVPSGYQQVVAFLTFFAPTGLAGSLTEATFVAKAAAAGDTSVLSRFVYTLDSEAIVPTDLAPLTTSIAAVPEPHSWITILAALGLLAAVAFKRSRLRV